MQNAKTFSGKALRAMHQLLQIIKEVETPMNISFKLFDSLVASVLMYGSEIWGYINAECIERVHRKFCKYMLNVKLSTNTYAVYSELGRYPLIIERQTRMVKYWFSLLQKINVNCILVAVYNSMKENILLNAESNFWLVKIIGKKWICRCLALSAFSRRKSYCIYTIVKKKTFRYLSR